MSQITLDQIGDTCPTCGHPDSKLTPSSSGYVDCWKCNTHHGLPMGYAVYRCEDDGGSVEFIVAQTAREAAREYYRRGVVENARSLADIDVDGELVTLTEAEIFDIENDPKR